MENEELLIRKLALEILLAVDRQEEMSHIITKAVLDKYDYLDGRKKALIKRLSQGCLQRKTEMDYVISLYSKTPVKKLKPVIRCILELGTYQILYMDYVFDTTACNLSVTLAKKRGFEKLSGFVNGILRNISRNKEAIPYPKKEDGFAQYASVRYSTPLWLVEMLQNQYSEEVCEKILSDSLKESAVCVRITKKGLEYLDTILTKWEEAGVEVCPTKVLDYAFYMKKTNHISGLFGYEEGYFTIQDLSSMLVAHIAPIRESDCVMDVCASPGGKSMHAAEKAINGVVYSFDVSDYKTSKIIENVNRLGLRNVNVRVNDATVYREEYKERADVLLADVPCSGLGVLCKKPDLKLRLTPEGLEELILLQRKILSVAASYVKPGGVLIYSTCTINRKENEENVEWFMKNYPFETEEIESLPDAFACARLEDKTVQLLQGVNEGDGFYVAKLRKKAD